MDIKDCTTDQWVERVQPSDYTNGRKGQIVDTDIEKNRVRVRWLFERDGSLVTTCNVKSGNGVRTWVNAKRLIKTKNPKG